MTASNDFYARFFKRTFAPPPTPEETWARHTSYLRNLATSPMGVECAERFTVPEVEEVEDDFKQALAGISDPELRSAVDLAAGKISAPIRFWASAPGTSPKTPGRIFFDPLSDNLHGLIFLAFVYLAAIMIWLL